MKQGYTHISFLLDKSGSMRACERATVEGTNSFLRQQRETPGEATMTFVQFDDVYELNYDFADIKGIPDLNENNYRPRGNTAYYDALSKCIDDTGATLARMAEHLRPSRVLVVIQTDGWENASRKTTLAQVRAKIKHQREKYNWDFMFLGANIDAEKEAEALGIPTANACSYAVSNTAEVFCNVGDKTSRYRSADSLQEAKLCASFSDLERERAISAPPVITTNTTSKKPEQKK